MDTLWAPWRLEYLAGKREDGCIFCKKPSDRERLTDHLILHVGELAFVILNRFPYHGGHLMVIPLRHTSDFLAVTAEEHAEMARLLQASIHGLKEVYRAEGFNIGMNLGHVAGAGIHEHLHYHVIPRWIGDMNFFPMLAGTRSIPELLTDSYAKLRPFFRGLEERGVLPAGGHAASEVPEVRP